MSNDNVVSAWQQWLQHPQRAGWRRALFQIHLWSGIGLGLYIFFISVTGSALVYRNEMYEAAESQTAIRFVSALIDIHTDFLAGDIGRIINGIGLSCDGPGLCDQTVKAIWALFGIVPAAMFVTGATMWWNRVLRPWRRRK